MEKWAVSAMCQKPCLQFPINLWLNVIIVKEYLSNFIIFMSVFQCAPSNPQLYVLLEYFC